MRVTVRLFASLREAAGGDRFDETFEGGPVTITMLRARLGESHPALRPYLERVAIAVNEEYRLDHAGELHDGDTVALIPPVAGGALIPPVAGGAPEAAPLFLVTHDALDPVALRAAVITPASGAYLLFEGVVRDHHEGRAVARLEYEAYEEMALRTLEQVGREVLDAYRAREVYTIAIHHRIGMLEVGDTSLLVAVASAHRQDAFEAGLRAIDRVKETVPVWKKEWGPDGSHWQEGVVPKPAG